MVGERKRSAPFLWDCAHGEQCQTAADERMLIIHGLNCLPNRDRSSPFMRAPIDGKQFGRDS
jgi:hypothetical protein